MRTGTRSARGWRPTDGPGLLLLAGRATAEAPAGSPESLTAVRRTIFIGDHPAGHRLRIRPIAQELGTSVMPVGEALRRFEGLGLEGLGLAESISGRDAVVKYSSAN